MVVSSVFSVTPMIVEVVSAVTVEGSGVIGVPMRTSELIVVESGDNEVDKVPDSEAVELTGSEEVETPDTEIVELIGSEDVETPVAETVELTGSEVVETPDTEGVEKPGIEAVELSGSAIVDELSHCRWTIFG